MSKNKILAIVIAAVVVVTGAVTATFIIKNNRPDTQVEPTTEITNVDATAMSDPEIVSETLVENLTDENGNPVTKSNGDAATKIRTIYETVANGKKKSGNNSNNTKKTTKKSNNNSKSVSGIVGKGLKQMEKAAVLGYSYNSEGDYFYTDDKDCWQYNFGYNEIYDQVAPLAVMYIDDIRIRFDYKDKSWMIQLWKGQYGWLFVGAEIGVYTTTDFTTADSSKSDINHYDCADKSDWLKMKMDLYWDDDMDGKYTKQFTREYTKYWWVTGFKLGTLNRFSSPIKELIMNARVTFKDKEQATLFTKGMKKAGFKSASSSSSLPNDSIYQTGSDVYFKWYSIYSNYVDQVAERHAQQTENDPHVIDVPDSTEATVPPADEKPD